MKLSFKERLSERLAEYPLLRTMLLNPWFAVALTLMLLVGLVMAILLPRIWTTSPPGVYPVVKVCLLDLLQARSLRSAALKHEAAGDHAAAARAWQSALGNNRADAGLYRGALRQLAAAPELPFKVVGRTLANSRRLLNIAGTNQADLEIIAAAYDKYAMPDEVYDLLLPVSEKLSPGLEGAYLRALFSLGKYEEFGRRRKQLDGQLKTDALLALYDAAYLAGWGPPSEVADHRKVIKAAMDDPNRTGMACRLEMALCRRLLDAEGYRDALRRLEERREDRIVNHTQYWLLLERSGRNTEARRLAQEFNRPPESPVEVVQMADALNTLDLRPQCTEFMRRHAPEYGDGASPWCVAVWAAYADVLIAERDWAGLATAASQMQTQLGSQSLMGGFGHFLEGRAAYAQGKKEAAQTAFAEAMRLGFPLGKLGIRAGQNLLQMGYPEMSLQILLPLESRLAGDADYWRAVFEVAYHMRRDEALLLKAASQAHLLNPSDREWQFNYAASLLISRRRPEEALKLTMGILAAEPDSINALINHAIALAQNGRREDAAAVLAVVPEDTLKGLRRHAYYLAWLEIHAAAGDWTRVRQALDGVQMDTLFPNQRLWIEEIRSKLPADPAKPA